MRMHKGLNQKGVTLVEIILVIAIIGILASTSVMLIGHLRYAESSKGSGFVSGQASGADDE